MASEMTAPEKVDDLDMLFGPCQPAAGVGVRPHEWHLRPVSLQQLDAASAEVLKQYLETSPKGLLLSSAMHRVHPILWLIDQGGHLWFAVEEVVNSETGEFLYAAARGSIIPSGHSKLGHPSLIMSPTHKSARIGGEIKFFPAQMQWKISNRSGRYGSGVHQTEEHLRAAADCFAKFGIELTLNYWDTKPKQ